MKFHVFYTDNLPEQIARDHAACCQVLGLSVQYHCFPTSENFHAIYRMHGDFMNRMMEEEKDEVVCFFGCRLLATQHWSIGSFISVGES